MQSRSSQIGNGGNNESKNANGWLITFSDLCTLLLTFFVLLFSFTSMDDQKLRISFQNFTGSCGILSFREYREISRPVNTLIEGLYGLLGERVVVGVEEVLLNKNARSENLAGSGNLLIIYRLEDGLRFVFGDRLLFSSGGVEINEDMVKILKIIAKFISVTGYQTYIDGHTDSIPAKNSPYASNEELSIARAINVRDSLAKLEKGISGHIALIGYGSLKPVASNESTEGRAKNRRVEIILKSQKYF
ncbi:MAG: flagellar motor protein MotB [Pseudomonadota bacterium]